MKASTARAVSRAFATLVAVAAVLLCASFLYRALTYHEEVLTLLSSWGFQWDESVVRQIIESGRNPWIHVEYEIHGGQRTSSGAYMVDVDTLILIVSGPRQEVLKAAQIYEDRL